ncbi:MAG TPA: transglycosylase SLT domain-containing protein [Bryobacteraceae bacterium]|nr:transglycosylase SLT domain-containing protein [Bryobacteraceae bacterium]
MRFTGYLRVAAGLALIAAAGLVSSCALTSRPQQFRTFLLPPQNPVAAATDEPVPEPPRLDANLYSNEAPTLSTSLPLVSAPKPSDTDFLLKSAEDHFAAGKSAYQDGRFEEARQEFDRALGVLLAAPDNAPDRARIDKRLEDLVDSIYRYDADQFAANQQDQVSYDKAPRDSILEMTFPVDPSLKDKVAAEVHGTVSELPLQESDEVIGAIHFFSTGRGKKIIEAGLRRQGRYKDMIERVLREEGLPAELIFVAQAESGFLPRAMSNKMCVGLWQFAKFRGKEYGLKQTPATDDRMDPEKATRAAARHLHDLYSHFGDWYLALAAYDCGPGCVDHAVMRTGYADFWELRRRNVLPKETANYVPVILAMTIIAKNAKAYGLDDLDADSPVETDTIELQTPTHIGLIADAVDRPVSELRDLNPALLKSVAPAGYTVNVPKGTLAQVETAFAVVPANKRDSWRLHRVETGETFAALAKRFNTQIASLVAANHDEVPEAGRFVAVPVSYPGDRVPVKKAASRHRPRNSTATVSHAAAHSTTPKTAHKRTTTVARKTKPRSAQSNSPASE